GILASAGGIDIDAVGAAGEDINITNTGGSIHITSTEDAVNAISVSSEYIYFTGGDQDGAYQFYSKPLYLDIITTPATTAGKLWCSAGYILNWGGLGLTVTGSAHFNKTGADYDFQVESDNKTHAIFVDGGTDQVLILSGGAAADDNPANATDINFYVSGSKGSIDSSTKGTSLFGGDVVVSGTLHLPGEGFTTATMASIKADELTTGTALNITSDSSDTSARALLAITNDNTAATKTTCLEIVSDASPYGEYFDGGVPLVVRQTANSPYANILIENSFDGASSANPVLMFKLTRTHTNIPDDTDIGTIAFRSVNDASSYRDYVEIIAEVSDKTNLADGGRLKFQIWNGAFSPQRSEILTLGGLDTAAGDDCEVTVNESAVDCNFRVESLTNTHMLFVDASNNSISVAADAVPGTDTNFFVSGTIDSKASSTISGSAAFGGDLVVSGGLYLEERSEPGTIADGTVVVYGKDDSGVTKLYFKNEDGETEIGAGGGGGGNTLNAAYDQGGAGVGAKITVDNQPVQMAVAGASSTAMAVTGSVLIGSASVEYSGHLPPMPGTDTSFFVSGAISHSGSNGSADITVPSGRGTAVFGGDVVISGSIPRTDLWYFRNRCAGDGAITTAYWYGSSFIYGAGYIAWTSAETITGVTENDYQLAPPDDFSAAVEYASCVTIPYDCTVKTFMFRAQAYGAAYDDPGGIRYIASLTWCKGSLGGVFSIDEKPKFKRIGNNIVLPSQTDYRQSATQMTGSIDYKLNKGDLLQPWTRRPYYDEGGGTIGTSLEYYMAEIQVTIEERFDGTLPTPHTQPVNA
ncbi:MAG: hypothetical protein CMB80_05285, partial [Flammeovirgaceae bacterium]|nr:hypothetical protein [Flammeovirgaceae bacterium]